MKEVAFAFVICLLVACQNKDVTKTHKKEQEVHEHESHKPHQPGSANEHMHQKSVEELIQRFESPERDEYQQPDKVLSHLGAIEGLTIMDIGAGSGYFSVRLAAKGARVIAADVDDEFQEYIKARIAKNNLTNIETRKIPYDSPGLSQGEVDMVLIVNTYHHIENRPEYFSQVKQGTTPNGELVIIDFFKTETPIGPPEHHKLAIDEVVYELKQAGYSSFEVNVDVLPYQYIIKAK